MLDLQLLSVEVKTTVLMEVLQPGETSSERLLPFIEALTDTLLGTWGEVRILFSCQPPNSQETQTSSRVPIFPPATPDTWEPRGSGLYQ